MTSDDFDRKKDRFERVRQLFERARHLPLEARENFLLETCGDDPDLRAEIEGLLASHEDPQFLTPPEVRFPEALLKARAIEQLVGLEVGPYKIVSHLASGGMSDVYLAHRTDGQFQLEVAIKVLKRGMDTEDILRRFRLEQHALARLNHPSIARILDGGSLPDGRPYLVMEVVRGASVTVSCNRKRMNLRGRLLLFLKICDAVQYAHQCLIVHRDLKPSNILVTDDGEPKLLDFGLAKLLNPDSPFATSSRDPSPHPRPLTAAYASPEQHARETVTTSTDIYSLGILLYELLVGHRPYSSLTPGSQIHLEAIRSRAPARPSRALVDSPGMRSRSLKRQLEGDLDKILLQALRPSPAERYSTVDQFREDIHRHLHGLPVRARPHTLLYRTGKLVGRHKIMAVVVAGFATALVTAMLLSVSGFRRAQLHLRTSFEAQRERSKVLDFVESLFYSVSYKKPPKDLSLDEILSSAVERIEDQPDGDELTTALLSNTVGKLFSKNGDFGPAEELLSKSLEIRERVRGKDSLEAANSHHNLAIHCRSRGDFDSALGHARAACEVYRSHVPSHRIQLIQTLGETGACLNFLGQSGEALAALEESLAMVRGLPDLEDSIFVPLLNNLALAYLAEGDLESGSRALDEARKRIEGENAEFGVLLNNIAKLHFQRNELEAARNLVSQALVLQRRFYGYAHHDTAMSLNNLALIALRENRLDDAEAHLREALGVYRELLGDDHPSTGTTSFNLGRVLFQRENFQSSLLFYEAALASFRSALPENHPRISQASRAINRVKAELESRAPRADPSRPQK